jgi:hypothetical protein
MLYIFKDLPNAALPNAEGFAFSPPELGSHPMIVPEPGFSSFAENSLFPTRLSRRRGEGARPRTFRGFGGHVQG